MKNQIRLISGVVLTFSAALTMAADVRPLTESCEAALAVSAAPEHLQSQAGVFILKESGYEKIRESSNGFNCIVERNHSESIIPICFGAASTDANLAAIIDGGRQIRHGASFEEMLNNREEAILSGAYARPGPGISFMISDYTYIFNSNAGAMLNVAPHLMFHAPGLSATDVGADNQAMLQNRGLPMINAPGPHGFMVSFIEKTSNSDEVERICQGQLPDPSTMISFP